MAPNPKVVAAYRAMGALGIAESKVKQVLKKLLKLYDKNWALIEEENYRALADAIFEDDDNKVPEQQKKSKNVDEEEMEDEQAQLHIEPARPLKRLRLRGQESQSLHPPTNSGPNSAASPLKKPKLETDILPGSSSRKRPQNTAVSSDGNARIEARPVPPHDGIVDKGKQPVSPQLVPRRRRLISGIASPSVPYKEPTVEPAMRSLPNNKVPHSHALIIPKDEPLDEFLDYEVPIAVIPPEPSSIRDSSMKNGAARKRDGRVTAALSQCRDEPVRDEDNLPSRNENVTSSVEIASSTMGEVKISLRCSSTVGGTEIHLPSRDQILQMMEDKCLRSYKITDPNFSVPKLLRDICDCMLEIRTDSNDDSQKGSMTTSSVSVMKESEANGILTVRANEDPSMHSPTSNGSINVESSAALASPQSPFSLAHLSCLDDTVRVSKMDATNGVLEGDYGKELEDPISPNSRSLVVVPQHHLTADDIRSFHDVNDLTKGEESVQISWVNESTNDFLPSFHYIPQNLVFRDACVNISLSCIGGEDCCSTCMGNCVMLSTPCACANKTGGEFAYTAEGLLKGDFLGGCISISRNPQQHYFYCKYCPLERSKSDGCLEPCKGHLKRKFIKECWTKCGCGKQCGNRVVQRGITCNLQVFFTSEGKGWGLRTLEDLPKGAFVCEFVGEILTIKELHERNMKCTENGNYTYPILLDADWDSGFVKDEDALCLDAASFGNTARFINHRCYDANLVEIPVEIEGPDHHYYHFALFTSRKIAAQEELTWDYGIDFDDHDHPVKLFQCRCGSKFCRNLKRSNGSIRSASIAR